MITCAVWTVRRPRIGHADLQSLRRGHYGLAVDAAAAERVLAALAELARAL
jgi:hypothetical protein